MNKALYPAIAIALTACIGPAAAHDLSLVCTLESGNRLPLTIGDGKVLKDGHPLRNFDRKSFAASPARIAFNQSFRTYGNAWRIDRNTLQISLKTILKRSSRVVLEEKGTCTGAPPAPQQAQRTPPARADLPAAIASMLGR